MRKLLDFLGMFIGGWVGWILGAYVSIFTAFILGVVGTGAGLYATRRFASRYL